MKKIAGCLFIVILLMLCGCEKTGEELLKQDGYTLEEVNIDIAEVTRPYKLVFVNDLHMQINNDEIASDEKDFMSARVKEFSYDGSSTYEKWQTLPDSLEKLNADLYVFGGDILDFCSKENMSELEKGLGRLNKPVLYVRSDHDVEPYWLESMSATECMVRQSEIAKFDDIITFDFGEFIVLGINLSQNNISDDALARIKEVFSDNRPIVIVTHIPIDQKDEDELAFFSESVRDGRRLYWGYGAEKEPNSNTREFIDMIYADDTPVKAVLGAHIHASWEGNITENVIEHIFGPCFMKNIGIVSIY